jgi:predicted  nucleic acid-binding Zn-ribbon protein
VTHELEVLLELNRHDAAIRDQALKIEGLRRRRASLVEAIAREHAEFSTKKRAFEELQRHSREKSREVDDLDAQIRADTEKLRTGLLSYKEMDALRVRVEHSRARMDQLEDEAIALINKVEEQTPLIRKAEEDFLKWKAKIDQEIAQIDREIASHTHEVERLQQERAQRAAAVDPTLLRHYEGLRTRYEDPIALVRHGVCSGCNLRVSEITVERVRQEIVTCENCSRLLYVK